MKNNLASTKWIARTLGIDPMQALEAFQRLERMNLIRKTENGKFRQSSSPLETTHDIPSAAIRKYHKQILNLALDKIETVPIDQREYSAITMAIDPKKMPKAKKMIEDFKHKLCAELETGQMQDVYNLSIQLFPLTTHNDGEKNEKSIYCGTIYGSPSIMGW